MNYAIHIYIYKYIYIYGKPGRPARFGFCWGAPPGPEQMAPEALKKQIWPGHLEPRGCLSMSHVCEGLRGAAFIKVQRHFNTSAARVKR